MDKTQIEANGQLATLYLGDSLEVLNSLPDNSVDSVVTDPPYEIGFMGRKWDATGIAFRPEIWEKCHRVLKPGGHLLAFGAPKNYHRLACAIEDAGFEIRDSLLWLFGSGFPKALDVSKAIDKELGREREAIGRNPNSRENCDKTNTLYESGTVGKTDYITKAGSPESAQWEGWKTSLKPAYESIVMGRKPLDGTVAKNTLKWGVGGLNIDGCRVPHNGDRVPRGSGDVANTNTAAPVKMAKIKIEYDDYLKGRFPSNVLIDEEVAKMIDEQSGFSRSSSSDKRDSPTASALGFLPKYGLTGKVQGHDDFGGASRFYYTAKANSGDRHAGLNNRMQVIISPFGENKWVAEDHKVQILVDTDQYPPRVIGVSGTQSNNVKEWSTTLSGKSLTDKYQLDMTSIIKTATSSTIELKILNYFLNCITSGNTADVQLETASGGSLVENAECLTPLITFTSERMGSLLGAENVALPMRWQISAKDASKSTHPTMKPTDLMQYLVRLVTPKGGIVLDPFLGSGSTGKAALLEQCDFIGIEREKEYYDIACARIKFLDPF